MTHTVHMSIPTHALDRQLAAQEAQRIQAELAAQPWFKDGLDTLFELRGYAPPRLAAKAVWLLPPDALPQGLAPFTDMRILNAPVRIVDGIRPHLALEIDEKPAGESTW